MGFRNLVLAAFVLVSCNACTKSQAPVGEAKSGGIVRGDSTDIPIYSKASGPTVDISKFPADIQLMFKQQVDVTPQIEAYNKANGHYPADYAEFKSGVVEPNHIKFPSNLPGGFQLQYDEGNHKVVVVKKKK